MSNRRTQQNSGKATKLRKKLAAQAERVRFHRRARLAAWRATWSPTAFDFREDGPGPGPPGEGQGTRPRGG